MNEELLVAAGVPRELWDKPEEVIAYLCRQVIALNEQTGHEPEVFDEAKLAFIEERTYKAIMGMNTIDAFSTYNKAYILSLPELERVAIKAALLRFCIDRNVDKPEHWM